MTPTPEQIQWLKDNYRLYSNYHLSVKMGMKQHDVEYLLRKHDLRKRASKIIPLTEGQKKFIEDNHQRKTADKMAKELLIAACRVRNYMRKNKLFKWRKSNANPVPKQIIPYNQQAKVEHVRPPAEYSAGQQSTIDKYLKMDI